MLNIFLGILRYKSFKSVFASSLLVIATFYFSIHAVIGNRGLIHWVELNKNIKSSSAKLHDLTIYKNSIEKKINGLNEDNLDLDLLDERIRNTLGYADRNETIIYNNQ